MMNKMMHALRIPTEMVLRSRFSDEAFVRVSDLPKIIRMNDVEMPLGLKRVLEHSTASQALHLLDPPSAMTRSERVSPASKNAS